MPPTLTGNSTGVGNGKAILVECNRSGGDKPRPYEGNVAMRGFVGEGFIPSRANALKPHN
jgi:hypothetical protein